MAACARRAVRRVPQSTRVWTRGALPPLVPPRVVLALTCLEHAARFQDGVVEDDVLKDMKALKALSTSQLTALVSMSLDFLTSTDGAYAYAYARRVLAVFSRAPRARVSLQ